MNISDFCRLQRERWSRLYGARFPAQMLMMLMASEVRFLQGICNCAACGKPHLPYEQLLDLIEKADGFELALRSIAHESRRAVERAGCMEEMRRIALAAGMVDRTAES